MATLRIPVGPDDNVQGPEDASITLVEYGDYQCPHCGHAYPIVKAVQRHYGNRLRFIFRDFPLREMHPWAEAAAESAAFAATAGRFWPMHDLLFENQQRLGNPLLAELGHQLGLDVPGLQQALKEGRFRDRVQQEFAGGVRSGVNGTPTFFINGRRHDGAFELESLIEAIDSRIAE